MNFSSTLFIYTYKQKKRRYTPKVGRTYYVLSFPFEESNVAKQPRGTKRKAGLENEIFPRHQSSYGDRAGEVRADRGRQTDIL